MMSRRRVILALSLAAAVALSLQSLFWNPEHEGARAASPVVEPVVLATAASAPAAARPKDSGQAPAAAAAQGDSLGLPSRPTPAVAPRDLFTAYSWLPPPPPPPPAAPPQAPPLPFSYGGRMEVEGKSTYLLLEGLRTYRAAIGDSLGEFKLESSGPDGLVFVHQPTGLTEVLAAPGLPVASN